MNLESPWKTYPKGILFILPALGAWVFAATFLAPRVKQLWEEAEFVNRTAHTVLNLYLWPLAHVGLVLLATVAVLALLEWRSRQWPRFRRLAVGTVAFIFNGGVIFFLTALLTFGLMAMANR